MAIFGKKKNEEEEKDPEEIKREKRADRKLTKKFKDLNPKNKKKRKEPPKPWGRKERIIVLAILIATILISGYLAKSSRASSGATVLKIDFGSFNLFGEKTIIIKKSP